MAQVVIYVVWHPRDARGDGLAEAIAAHLDGEELVRDGIGLRIPVRVRSRPWNGTDKGRPRPIDFDAAEVNVVVVLESWDLRDAAGADWRDFFNELASERAGRPERTLVLPFGTGGEPLPGLFMVQRVFTAGWPESDTDPSWRTRLLLHIVNAVGRHNKARDAVAQQGGARFDSQFEAEIARSAPVAIRSDR